MTKTEWGDDEDRFGTSAKKNEEGELVVGPKWGNDGDHADEERRSKSMMKTEWDDDETNVGWENDGDRDAP